MESRIDTVDVSIDYIGRALTDIKSGIRQVRVEFNNVTGLIRHVFKQELRSAREQFKQDLRFARDKFQQGLSCAPMKFRFILSTRVARSLTGLFAKTPGWF